MMQAHWAQDVANLYKCTSEDLARYYVVAM